MANSLRAKLKKLKHDGNITEEEYQELLKKLDGHDKKIIANTIDEFAEDMLNKINFEEEWLSDCKSNNADTGIVFRSIKHFIKNRAKQLKEQNNG